MKTLLIPTDFSKNAGNALHFGILLAKKIKAKIVLMNAFQVPVPIPITEQSYNVIQEDRWEKKKVIENKLRNECEKIKHAGGIDFEYEAIEGSVIDAVLEFSKKRHFDYMILGTHGAGENSSFVFGNTASRLVVKTNVPLIIVPRSVHFKGDINKITYATNYDLSDVNAICNLAGIAKFFEARINVLHVSEKDIPQNEQIATMRRFMTIVKSETNYNNLSYQILSGENVDERLEQYLLEDKDADLIVMSTYLRSALERLFGKKSHTKNAILITKTPLIIFHHQKAEREVFNQ